MEGIETTMKCDAKWNELTRMKIKNSKLKLRDKTKTNLLKKDTNGIKGQRERK